MIELSRHGDKILIGFPYNKEMVEAVKKIEGREFKRELSNRWTVDADNYKEVRYRLRDYDLTFAPDKKEFLAPHLYVSDKFLYHVRLHSASEKRSQRFQRTFGLGEYGLVPSKKLKRVLVDDRVVCEGHPEEVLTVARLAQRVNQRAPKINSKICSIILLRFQEKAVNRMLAYKRVIIGDEMGMGKTLMTVYAAARLFEQKKINRVLVLCPASMIYDWSDKIKEETSLSTSVITGGDKKLWQSNANFTIGTYESVVSNFEVATSQYWDVIAADETFKIKSSQSKRSKAFSHLNSEYLWLLSGTVIENDLQELFTLLRFIAPDKLENYFALRDRYMIVDRFGSAIDYKRQDEIRARVSNIILSRLKEDVRDQGLSHLAEVKERNIKVKLCPETQRIYDLIEDELRDTIEAARKLDRLKHMTRVKGERAEALHDNLPVGKRLKRFKLRKEYNVAFESLAEIIEEVRSLRAHALSLFSLLVQVCDSAALLKSSEAKQAGKYYKKLNLSKAKSTKMEMLLNLLQNELPEGAKVVVFTQYERMLRIIVNKLREKGIKQINVYGGDNPFVRSEKVKAFKRRPKVRALVATDCLTYGKNLQEAQYLINYDLPYNPAVLAQRNGRIHRVDTTFDEIYIYNIYTETRAEERIVEILKPKVALSNEILGSGSKTKKRLGFKGLVELLEG